MSYTLGGETLPTPKPGNYQRKIIEIGGSVLTLNGTTKKDIVARKYQHVISYEMLTQAEVTTILSLYEDRELKSFQVDETNLTISAVDVHVDLLDRSYNTAGEGYREDITLVLTEEEAS